MDRTIANKIHSKDPQLLHIIIKNNCKQKVRNILLTDHDMETNMVQFNKMYVEHIPFNDSILSSFKLFPKTNDILEVLSDV